MTRWVGVLMVLTGLAAQEEHAWAKAKKTSHHPGASGAPAVQKRLPSAPRPSRGSPAKRGESGPGASEEAVVLPPESGAAGAASTTKTAKTKVYTFGAMDVEGKLKTPQLLYFLSRIKLELEMSAPDHRSFMKELEKTADDPNL